MRMEWKSAQKSTKSTNNQRCRDQYERPEVRGDDQFASAVAAMATLKRTWRSILIRFTSNFNLYRSFVTSILLYGCETRTLLADSETNRVKAFGSKVPEEFLRITWSTNQRLGVEQDQLSRKVHRNLFWQLARDGNSRGSGMSRSTTASPKPSFRVPWRAGDAVVGRGNAGQATSKSGYLCL